MKKLCPGTFSHGGRLIEFLPWRDKPGRSVLVDMEEVGTLPPGQRADAKAAQRFYGVYMERLAAGLIEASPAPAEDWHAPLVPPAT